MPCNGGSRRPDPLPVSKHRRLGAGRRARCHRREMLACRKHTLWRHRLLMMTRDKDTKGWHMVVHDEKYERAFRVLTTEMFSLWLKLHVLSTIVEAHLPPEEKGAVDKASANYLRSHGDQALVSFLTIYDRWRIVSHRITWHAMSPWTRCGVSLKPCAFNTAKTWPSGNGAVCGAPSRCPTLTEECRFSDTLAPRLLAGSTAISTVR